MKTETETETFTVTVTTEEDATGAYVLTVRALVEDGRSTGPYYALRSFTETGSPRAAVAMFLREIGVLGQELHPEL